MVKENVEKIDGRYIARLTRFGEIFEQVPLTGEMSDEDIQNHVDEWVECRDLDVSTRQEVVNVLMSARDELAMNAGDGIALTQMTPPQYMQEIVQITFNIRNGTLDLSYVDNDGNVVPVYWDRKGSRKEILHIDSLSTIINLVQMFTGKNFVKIETSSRNYLTYYREDIPYSLR